MPSYVLVLCGAWFIFLTVAQLPSSPFTVSRWGNCTAFESHLLGSLSQTTRSGLIAQQLSYEAQNEYRNTRYFTTTIPEIRLIRAKVVCSSFGLRRDRFGTVTVLAEYRCVGLACIHDTGINDAVYTHQFSFICRPGDNQYTTNDYYSGSRPFTNREVLSTVQNARTSTQGQCITCFSDPAIGLNSDLRDRADRETGCVGMFQACTN